MLFGQLVQLGLLFGDEKIVLVNLRLQIFNLLPCKLEIVVDPHFLFGKRERLRVVFVDLILNFLLLLLNAVGLLLQAVDLILNVGRILGGDGRKHGAQGGKHEQKGDHSANFCKIHGKPPMEPLNQSAAALSGSLPPADP